MAFLQNGTWVPDQPLSSGVQSQARAGGPNMVSQMQPTVQQAGSAPQIAQAATHMQAQNQAPMQFQNYPMQNQMQMAPQQMMYNPSMLQMLGSTPQNQAPVSNPVQQMAPVQTQSQGGVLPDGPPDPGRVQMIGRFQMPQAPQMPHPGMNQPLPQSVMQSVNNANPQSVQNFLQALNQSPQAAQNNAWQNPIGVQGQGPQAGFQGFQQNGTNAAPQTNWQRYSQNKQPQLGSYSNQARQGSPVQANQSGMQNNVTSGGTGGAPQGGGVPGQIPYRTPSQSSMSTTYHDNLRDTINNGLAAASDINSKQNITAGDGELQSFLDSLGVYSYEYKDPKYGEGRRISPMAQEIEQTELGKAAISTNNEGYKIVDYGKLMGTQLAALALLNHKYNNLENQLKQAVLEGLKSKGKK